jgi:hypothetical protein
MKYKLTKTKKVWRGITLFQEEIIKMIKENTLKNRYRDGETAFDIVKDIEEFVYLSTLIEKK